MSTKTRLTLGKLGTIAAMILAVPILWDGIIRCVGIYQVPERLNLMDNRMQGMQIEMIGMKQQLVAISDAVGAHVATATPRDSLTNSQFASNRGEH